MHAAEGWTVVMRNLNSISLSRACLLQETRKQANAGRGAGRLSANDFCILLTERRVKIKTGRAVLIEVQNQASPKRKYCPSGRDGQYLEFMCLSHTRG